MLNGWAAAAIIDATGWAGRSDLKSCYAQGPNRGVNRPDLELKCETGGGATGYYGKRQDKKKRKRVREQSCVQMSKMGGDKEKKKETADIKSPFARSSRSSDEVEGRKKEREKRKRRKGGKEGRRPKEVAAGEQTEKVEGLGSVSGQDAGRRDQRVVSASSCSVIVSTLGKI